MVNNRCSLTWICIYAYGFKPVFKSMVVFQNIYINCLVNICCCCIVNSNRVVVNFFYINRNSGVVPFSIGIGNGVFKRNGS